MKTGIPILIIICFVGFLNAQAPPFQTGEYIQFNNSPIILTGNYDTAPCVVDWNNDGKKDLLVGCFYSGSVYLFLNTGTNEAPLLTSRTKLQADGRDITVPYG